MIKKNGIHTAVAAVAITLGASLSFSVPQTVAAEQKKLDGVVELFTSQGCSSCPPADKVLGELVDEKRYIALSFPVDYWDYLGWKDTLASPEFTARQRSYSRVRGDRAVYTPQMVVNGRAHIPGYDGSAVRKEVKRQKQSGKGLSVALDLQRSGDVLTILAPSSPANTSKATLWLVSFDRAETVEIGRGENRGRTITYFNVVKRLQALAMWSGDAVKVDLPLNELKRHGADGCAILLQKEANGLPGSIIGAAILPHLSM